MPTVWPVLAMAVIAHLTFAQAVLVLIRMLVAERLLTVLLQIIVSNVQRILNVMTGILVLPTLVLAAFVSMQGLQMRHGLVLVFADPRLVAMVIISDNAREPAVPVVVPL